ncbi:MAG: hypothetical protein AAGH15_18655 [Myxococcota bacterium]
MRQLLLSLLTATVLSACTSGENTVELYDPCVVAGQCIVFGPPDAMEARALCQAAESDDGFTITEGNFCTYPCDFDEDCLPGRNGQQGICDVPPVPPGEPANRVCLETCVSFADCPPFFDCFDVSFADGVASVCLPG